MTQRVKYDLHIFVPFFAVPFEMHSDDVVQLNVGEGAVPWPARQLSEGEADGNRTKHRQWTEEEIEGIAQHISSSSSAVNNDDRCPIANCHAG